jgi:hypothetical protein
MGKLRTWWDENKLSPKQMEAVGVGVLAMAAFLEVNALRQVVDFVQEAEFKELEHKLSEIWRALGSSNPAQHVTDYAKAFDVYNVIGKTDEYRQIFIYEGPKLFRNACYAVGTFLVVLGKWIDGTPKTKA